jgi:polyisoprenoid-binding protein YceI
VRLGPDNASLHVLTYREGVAAKVGHDLVLEVTRWQADVEADAVELTADSRSLAVLEGRRGVKPLTDRDREEIRRNIEAKVLQGRPIAFRSTALRRDGAQLVVEGELTIGGATRPLAARLEVRPDGVATGTIPLTQSDFGIKPYRGLMGALKVRDELEVAIEAPLADG